MRENLIRNNPLGSGFILIHHCVLENIRQYRQVSHGSREAGGLLLGFRRGAHLEIVDATLPYPRDKRKRTFFDRCDPKHEKYALKQWTVSGKTMDYLGEWHTHPEAVPHPSLFDMSEWRKLLTNRSAPLVFLILGTNSVWMGCGNRSVIKCCDS